MMRRRGICVYILASFMSRRLIRCNQQALSSSVTSRMEKRLKIILLFYNLELNFTVLVMINTGNDKKCANSK